MMKIPELPQPLQELARKYQRDEIDKDYFSQNTDDLFFAFDWDNTEEGRTFWDALTFIDNINEVQTEMDRQDRYTLDKILNTPKPETQSSYYPLFEHLSNEHNLTLLNSELEEIIRIVLGLNKTFTKTSCHGKDAEYPTEQGSYFCFDERGQMIVMEWNGNKESWSKIDWWLKKEEI